MPSCKLVVGRDDEPGPSPPWSPNSPSLRRYSVDAFAAGVLRQKPHETRPPPNDPRGASLSPRISPLALHLLRFVNNLVASSFSIRPLPVLAFVLGRLLFPLPAFILLCNNASSYWEFGPFFLSWRVCGGWIGAHSLPIHCIVQTRLWTILLLDLDHIQVSRCVGFLVCFPGGPRCCRSTFLAWPALQSFFFFYFVFFLFIFCFHGLHICRPLFSFLSLPFPIPLPQFSSSTAR